ncbi:MAG TPA: hypothetical protein VH165_26150 [Kofleriaceae bacterium]|nr:hypothetical protein [Kofleriaceae bacterium]
MKRLACLSVVLLAACPPPGGGPQPPVTPAATGAGCPAASNVFVASYLTQDENGAGDASAGHTGWVLPLHDLRVADLTHQPEFAELDATAAGAAGVPVAPASVWLILPGQPMCHATVGKYYAAAVDSTIPNINYGVELSGCAAPPKDQQQDAEAIALATDAAPTECQALTAQPVATRLGETDAQKQWQRPTKETAMPPAFASAVPPHDCRAPGCETLWAVAQVDVAGVPVAWAGAVNWLTIPPNATPASQCSWKVETFAGFFVPSVGPGVGPSVGPGTGGRAIKVTEGQDHPLLLSSVLADHSGPRALVAEGAGEYTTYDLIAGAPKVARHLVWLLLPPEAYAVDERIGPSCGDDALH